jgi:hypothetical protein
MGGYSIICIARNLVVEHLFRKLQLAEIVIIYLENILLPAAVSRKKDVSNHKEGGTLKRITAMSMRKPLLFLTFTGHSAC